MPVEQRKNTAIKMAEPYLITEVKIKLKKNLKSKVFQNCGIKALLMGEVDQNVV